MGGGASLFNLLYRKEIRKSSAKIFYDDLCNRGLRWNFGIMSKSAEEGPKTRKSTILS